MQLLWEPVQECTSCGRKVFVLNFQQLSFEPGMVGLEAQMLPLCCAFYPFPLTSKNLFYKYSQLLLA